MSESQQWFFARDGQTYGPYDRAQVKAMAMNGQLLPSDELWIEGYGKRLAGDYKGLFPPPPPVDSFDATPPRANPAPTMTAAPPAPPQPKPLPRWQVNVAVWAVVLIICAAMGSVGMGISFIALWFIGLSFFKPKLRTAYIAAGVALIFLAIGATGGFSGDGLERVVEPPPPPPPPKQTHTIRFSTTPVEAELRLFGRDGSFVAEGASDQAFELLPGFYRAEVRASGYTKETFSFTITKPGVVKTPALQELAIDPALMVAVCQRYVLDQLKAPKTAEFPPMDIIKWPYVDTKEAYWESYVDAQNSFGALIRTRYTCTYNKAQDKLTTRILK